MQNRNGFYDSRSHSLINFIASLIGILGFLTGVNNMPSLIAGNGNLVSWFESQISYWLSIPAFIFAVFFVYGLYFLMLVQIYKWFYWYDVMWWHFSWFGLLEFIGNSKKMLKEIESTLVSVFFFSIIGYALGGLIFQAFFGLSILNELQASPFAMMIFILISMVLGIFLAGLCGTAQNTAHRITNELRNSSKEKANV
jgi:hypothetical protein